VAADPHPVASQPPHLDQLQAFLRAGLVVHHLGTHAEEALQVADGLQEGLEHGSQSAPQSFC
jgi:hypothetical protein